MLNIDGIHGGRCVEIGTRDGTPRVVVHSTESELSGGRNMVLEEVAVIRADELVLATVEGFDRTKCEVTLKFDTMPAAVVGVKWVVRPNP